jgi:hypothetical protein
VVADSSGAIVNIAGRTGFHPIASWLAAACLCAAVLFAGDRSARAQPYGEVVVVPVEVGDVDQGLSAITTTVEAGLVDENVTLISQHDARDRFVARSRPPQTPNGSDVEALARAAHEALEHVAYGRTAAARKSVQQVIALAERTLESLNRETATARNVLNACLSLVRGSLQEHKRDAALAQAMQCRRLVPDLTPNEATHPANVVGVLAEADNLLRRMRLGSLQVSSFPDERCSVYVNGRHLGTTPFKLDRAATGEYRVQVECGALAGRVHVVQLGDAPVRLLVDTAFDRVVESARRLALRYPTQQEAWALSVEHAAALGGQIGANDVVLVEHEADNVVLSRVEVEQKRLIARATVPWSARATQAAFQPAMIELAEARLATAKEMPRAPDKESPTSAEARREPALSPEPTTASEPPASNGPADTMPEITASPNPRDKRRRALRVAGVSTFGLGLLSIATGAILETMHGQDGHALALFAGDSDAYSLHVQEWRDGRMPPFAFAITGAALGAVGAGLLAAADVQVPVWVSATSAAVGIGLFSWGVVNLAKSEPCSDQLNDQRGCAVARDQGERGAILMISAVPLFALPAALLIRKIAGGGGEGGNASRLRVSPTAALGGGGFRAGVHVLF